LRFMAGLPFAGSQLKNVGHFTPMALRRDNPLCRSAAHLSKGVLGLAVDIRLVACRQWQLWVLCHEHRSVHTAVRNYTGDEGRSFEFDNQVLISNHRKLLWSKARVVNVAEKAGQDPVRHGRERRA
jgi:hypothetical protein